MDDFVRLLFLVNIAWIFAHELDAIQQHEWRFFPFLRPFSDVTAYRIFVALHIPLLAWIIWASPYRDFQIGFDLFLIVHAGLHWALRNHPLIEFRNAFSRLLIFGVVPLAVLHLALILTR
jgi:hypothetical protein